MEASKIFQKRRVSAANSVIRDKTNLISRKTLELIKNYGTKKTVFNQKRLSHTDRTSNEEHVKIPQAFKTISYST